MAGNSFRSAFLITATSLALFASLAACGDKKAAAPETPDPTEQTRIEVDTTIDIVDPTEPTAAPFAKINDTLGTFDSDVFGLALWQNPKISFLSGIIAANGPEGLFLIHIDRSGAAQVPGNFSGGVAVGYSNNEAFTVAYENDAKDLRLFAIDPGSRTLLPISAAAVKGGAPTLCFMGQTIIRLADDDSVYRHELSVQDGNISLVESLVPETKAIACAGTNDTTYLLSATGRVIPLHPDGSKSPSQDGLSGALQIMAFPTADGVQLAFLNRAGQIVVNGDALNVQLDGAVTKSVRTAAGSGNFGGVYRDGVLGVLTEENTLGLVPWAAITFSLGIEARSISLLGENAGVSAEIFSSRPIPEGEMSTAISDETRAKLDDYLAPPPSE